MTQDLTQQWLTEIQALQESTSRLQSERNAAWESSEKWRKLYNIEAEQRRTDSQLAQQAISLLKAQIQELQGIEDGVLSDGIVTKAIQKQIEQLNTVDELKAKLVAVIKERERLQQALKIEQENHALTRKSLTTALGDAIDSLTKERDGVGGK
jgi:hypothetical protein